MSKKKNILFLFPDQHRGDWMPPSDKLDKAAQHNPSLEMPTLSKLMQTGFVFSNATTPSPLCAPARGCLAQGKNYFGCGVPSNVVNYPEGRRSIYNMLKEDGYNVLSCGKLDVHKATKFWGEKGWVDSLGEMGFTKAIDNEGKIDAIIGEIGEGDISNPSGVIQSLVDVEKDHKRGPYINYLYHEGVAEYHAVDMNNRNVDGRDINLTELSDEQYCDNWLTNNGIGLLEEVPVGEPWFLQVNFTGPHDPWDITKSMKARVEGRTFEKPYQGDAQYEEKDLIIRAHYTAMLENIDDNIKKLLEVVESRGEMDDTIIIYASDHGEMLGEYGMYGKCCPEKGSVHIPMIIAGKGVASGKSNALVQLQDIPATIAGVCNLEESFSDSNNLFDIVDSKKNKVREVQMSALGNWYCINDEEFKLMKDKNDNYKLFNVKKDPWEINDIAKENGDIVERLKGCFEKESKKS